MFHLLTDLTFRAQSMIHRQEQFMTRYLRILAAALLAATLSACGGSTGPQSSAGTPMIAAASQVSGTVTGLASVVVEPGAGQRPTGSRGRLRLVRGRTIDRMLPC